MRETYNYAVLEKYQFCRVNYPDGEVSANLPEYEPLVQFDKNAFEEELNRLGALGFRVIADLPMSDGWLVVMSRSVPATANYRLSKDEVG